MDNKCLQDQSPVYEAPMPGSATQRVRIDKAGRLVVPANIRKALGIEDGQELTVRLVDGGIRLQTLDAGLERVWAIAGRRGKTVPDIVDDFIAERRAEASGD